VKPLLRLEQAVEVVAEEAEAAVVHPHPHHLMMLEAHLRLKTQVPPKRQNVTF
jgi:hypothetical protein